MELAKLHGIKVEESSDKPGIFIHTEDGEREIAVEDVLGL